MMSINETLVYGSRTERNIRQSKSITAVKDVFWTTTAYVLYYANGQQIAYAEIITNASRIALSSDDVQLQLTAVTFALFDAKYTQK